MLTRAETLALNESRLLEFLEAEPGEGHQLDYKAGLSSEDKKRRRDLLTDVASFANAHGGTLLFGIDEPDGETNASDRIKGIPDAESVAHILERQCTSCIEPRIAGLVFHVVPMASSNPVIVVHVPQSFERPHVAVCGKERLLYVRHSESSMPMTAFEIREAVTSDFSYRAQARRYADRLFDRYAKAGFAAPLLVMQAVPIPSGTDRLDVGDAAVRGRLANPPEQMHQLSWQPESGQFSPTIDGVYWTVKNADPCIEIDVHHDGYVQLRLGLRRKTWGRNHPGWEGRYLCDQDGQLMRSFGEFCQHVVTVSGIDSPYLMSCRLLQAKRARYRRGPEIEPVRFAGHEEVLEWPERTRSSGQAFEEVTSSWARQLRNAFGIEADG